MLTEPRSLWGLAQVNRASTSILRVTFDRENFRNGSRWPITLERLVVSPIGYHRLTTVGTFADDNMVNMFLASRLRIGIPGRQHYMRKPMLLSSLPLYQKGVAVTQTFLVRRKFDPPVLLPARGTIQLDLMPVPNFFLAAESTFTIGFQQLSDGLYGGEGRVTETALVQTAVYDYGSVGSGGNVIIAAGGTTTNPWPPQMRFSSRVFNQQQSGRSATARTPVTGVNVMIGHPTSNPAGVLNFVGSRMRVVDGDSHGEYWWRPEAPLALVFDDITPALVFELPVPITLEPGDTIDLELEVRSEVVGSPPQTPNYIVGVSFNGYAEIEG